MKEVLQEMYSQRFNRFRNERLLIWKTLTEHFFERWIKPSDRVLDVGSGYCEFINNVTAARKVALDLNPATAQEAAENVLVIQQDIAQPWSLGEEKFDVVFSSNFLEHLSSKEEVLHCLRESHRLLQSSGLILLLGPNIRFCSDVYWDFFDHKIALSDRSIVEALELAGFEIQYVAPRFLPYMMSGELAPPHPLLVRFYLWMPCAWPLFGKQFLVVARKI